MSDDTTIWTDERALKFADDIVGNINAFTKAVDALPEKYAAVRAAAQKEMTVRGVLPRNASEMLDDIEIKERGEDDKHLQTIAMEGVLKPLVVLEDALTRATAFHQTLRPWTKYTTTTEQLLAQNLDVMQRWQLSQQMAGKTLADVVKKYESSSDTDHGGTVAHIEEEHQTNFLTLATRATTSEKDAEAMQRLNKAIAARREARTPLFVREIRANLKVYFPDTTRMRITDVGRGKVKPASSQFGARPKAIA